MWAREPDPESNRDPIREFPGRSGWLVEPDQPSPRLRPYAGAPFRPMHFVPLGAPAIAVLQPGERLRCGILERAAVPADTCAAWNGFFTEGTGAEGPPLSEECRSPNRPPVSFDRWHAWLRHRH